MTIKELSIEAKKDNFEEVLSFVENALDETDCPPDIAVSVNICLEEIYINIASYAYEDGRGDGMANIKLEIEKDPYEVKIYFKDSGIPYNPLTKEDPDITLSAEERKIGGLGIFMVKKMMDDVEYEYKDGYNILKIAKSKKA